MPEKGYFMGRLAGRVGDTGRKAETRTAKRLKAERVTRASGAMASDKGDIVLSDFLVENKSTVNESMSVQYDWLTKISREALEDKKAPALTVQFTDNIGRPKKFGSWVMIPEALFEEVQALYRERMS